MYLGGQGPCDRTPRDSVRKHKDEHERDADPSLSDVFGPVVREFGHENGNDDVRETHPDRSLQEPEASAESVQNEKGDTDGDQLDDVQDASHIQTEFEIETELFKQGGAIVDELRDKRRLAHHSPRLLG